MNLISKNRVSAVLLFGAALFMVAFDASAQRGGGGGRTGGGGRMASSSVSAPSTANRGGSYGNRGGNASGNASGNRSGNASGNASGNRSATQVNGGNNVNNASNNRVNTGNINTGDVNINRGDVNIDVDGGYNGYHGGFYRHPVAAGAYIGAVAVTTAAVMGSYYYALPPSGCATVVKNGHSYFYCGSVYYQKTFSGDDVVYVVVKP